MLQTTLKSIGRIAQEAGVNVDRVSRVIEQRSIVPCLIRANEFYDDRAVARIYEGLDAAQECAT